MERRLSGYFMRRLKSIFLLLTFFCFYPLKAEVTSINGQLSGGTNIRSVQSQYFLIIFPEQCIESAMELRKNADSICQRICQEMNLTCPFKAMPVVITQSTDVFNAYFSNASYNHIVLFDAAAKEDLSVYSDTLLSTFEHELTHALTVNQKSDKFRHRLCNMIYWGDYIETPSMIKEGAAVAQESRNGQGRLNSSFFLHTIRQAKLSGEFPSWADVLGSRDIYPAGSTPYIFGSSFTQWLQEKYGMQKYADFWWEIINNFHITFRGGFQKVYGVNLNLAWKEFMQSVQVPSINGNPLAEEFVGDFFREAGKKSGKSSVEAGKSSGKSDKSSGKPGKALAKKLDAKNLGGYRYTGLASCKKGFAYIEGETSSVYFSGIKKDGTFEKPKKLFSLTGLTGISLSPDGEFLAVSYYSYNSMNVKTKVKLYNMQTKAWTTLDETGLRDATVLIARGAREGKPAEYALAAVKVCGQKSFIKTYRIKEDMLLEDKSIVLPENRPAFSLCGGSRGNLAYLCKDGLEWKIQNLFVYGKNRGSGSEYYLGKNVELRDLSFYYGKKTPSGLSPSDYPSGEESLVFSLAMPGTFPRLCITEAGSAFVMQEDISGGVYSPVSLGEKTVYSAHFYTDSKLLEMRTEGIPLAKTNLERRDAFAEVSLLHGRKRDALGSLDEEGGSEPSDIGQGAEERQDTALGTVQDKELDKETADFLADAKPYKNMFSKKLSVLPFSYIPQYDINGNLTNTIIFPGIMAVYATPWDNELLYLSTGWDIFGRCGGVSARLQGGSMAQTPLFVYTEAASFTYDASGIRQLSNSISLSNTVQVGNTGSITAMEQNLLVDGKQRAALDDDLDFSIFVGQEEAGVFTSTKLDDSDNHSFFSVQNALSLEYSNIHKTGAGYWNRSGFSFSTVYANKYIRDKSEDRRDTYTNSQLFPSATVRIGRLLPIDCKQGLTYNLPTALSGSIFYNATSLFRVSAESILFASEIQRGLRPVPLYFKRFSISAGYSLRMIHINDNMEIFRLAEAFKEADRVMIEDALSLNASIYDMINTGELASPSIMHKLTLSFIYHPHRLSEDTDKFKLGVRSSFFF
ncbi:MAG: hypothetical protein J5817_10065 [Treponema sp.]|nr:hypothetical protein [Treponema sp.]